MNSWGEYSRDNDYCQEEKNQVFRNGLNCTSLRKLCSPCVASIATACATSSGRNTFVASFGPRPENSVATLPGQIVLTRMRCSRNSSAMHPLNPCTPHFEAQYTPPPANTFFPASELMLIMSPP